MPITPTEQSRAVCLALPEIGWKEGEKCKGAMNLRGYCESCGTLNPRQSGVPNRRDSFAAAETEGRKFRHDIPPPDLASPLGADALISALRKRGYMIYFKTSVLWIGLGEAHPESIRLPLRYDEDYKPALLNAVYKILCEGK